MVSYGSIKVSVSEGRADGQKIASVKYENSMQPIFAIFSIEKTWKGCHDRGAYGTVLHRPAFHPHESHQDVRGSIQLSPCRAFDD